MNLQSTAYAHSGSDSIAVTYAAWTGLQLDYPELDSTGFSYLRFFIKGGPASGQQLQVYAPTVSGQNGPPTGVTVTGAPGTWAEVDIPLAQLGITNTFFTGLVWQGTTNGSQPTLYLDDIALAANVDANAPTLSAGTLLPRGIPADGATQAVIRVSVGDPQGLGDVTSVTLDGSAIGRGIITLRDDGWSNDGAAFTVPPGTLAGEHILVVSPQDQAGHVASLRPVAPAISQRRELGQNCPQTPPRPNRFSLRPSPASPRSPALGSNGGQTPRWRTSRPQPDQPT